MNGLLSAVRSPVDSVVPPPSNISCGYLEDPNFLWAVAVSASHLESKHPRGSVLRAVHKVCTGPYPSCIVVPSTSNNEPCHAFI